MYLHIFFYNLRYDIYLFIILDVIFIQSTYNDIGYTEKSVMSRVRRGLDRMVVGFINTYAISAYHQ